MQSIRNDWASKWANLNSKSHVVKRKPWQHSLHSPESRKLSCDSIAGEYDRVSCALSEHWVKVSCCGTRPTEVAGVKNLRQFASTAKSAKVSCDPKCEWIAESLISAWLPIIPKLPAIRVRLVKAKQGFKTNFAIYQCKFLLPQQFSSSPNWRFCRSRKTTL